MSMQTGDKVSKDSEQPPKQKRKYRITHLGNLNQVIVALGKTIRAMADGSLDSQKGARVCAGLGILRAALETRMLEQIEQRLAGLSLTVAQRDVERQRLGYQNGYQTNDSRLIGTN